MMCICFNILSEDIWASLCTDILVYLADIGGRIKYCGKGGCIWVHILVIASPGQTNIQLSECYHNPNE